MSQRFSLSKLAAVNIVMAAAIIFFSSLCVGAFASNSTGITLLHKGVKINSVPLKQPMFMISQAQMSEFLLYKAEAEMLRAKHEADTELLADYKKAIAKAIDKANMLASETVIMAEKVIDVSNDNKALISENLRARNRLRRANLLNIFLVSLGVYEIVK